MNKIGFLYSMTKKSLRKQLNAFFDGLKSAHFVDGKDGQIVFRVAEDDYDLLARHAKELVADPEVKVIVAAGGPVSALKAKEARAQAGSNVPIVYTPIADPAGYGLTPAHNATGTAGLTTELDLPRLKYLKELVPTANVVGLLVNPNRPNEQKQTEALAAAARDLGLTPVRVPAGTASELESAHTRLKNEKVHALLVTADPFFNSRREEVIKLATRLKRPAIYQWREFAEAGGLMSFGPSIAQSFETAGNYAGQIFAGTATAANLPIVEIDPESLKPVINMKAAAEISLDIPLSLLGRSELINETPERLKPGMMENVMSFFGR
jgi:putative ABC transport system substrate-binding protein